MTDVCKSIFVGNLADDPKKVETSNDSSMVSFRIVTNSYRGKDNDELVQSHPIVAFGNDADFILKYAKKGHRIYVESEIEQTKKGEGDDAQYFTNHKVKAFDLFGKRDKSND